MNIKRIIREEVDDFDWIRDIEPRYTPVVGDIIKVINTGNLESYVNWLGIYDDDYIDGRFGTHITGVVQKVYNTQFKLIEKNTGQDIYFPFIDVDGNIDVEFFDYPDLKLRYINESDGLDWIRDIGYPIDVTADNVYEGAKVILKDGSRFKGQQGSSPYGVISGDMGEHPCGVNHNILCTWAWVNWENRSFVGPPGLEPGTYGNNYRIGPHEFDLEFYYP